MTEQNQSFEPFADEPAYIHVNEKLVDRMMKRLQGVSQMNVLDLAAGTGLMTALAWQRAKAAGASLHATLLDLDLPALNEARKEPRSDLTDYIFGSADYLPLVPKQGYNATIFANSIHLLEQDAKERSLEEVMRVMSPGGVLAINSTFYDGAYPEESKPFYSRWIRRSIVEINRRLPNREKSEKVQAMDWLQADGYRELVECAGFKIVETRERRVLLSQAAVRAISSYSEFAKGALHATDEDAEQASQALQACVRQTFHDLNMKYLPRNWLEIIAIKP